MADNSPIYKRYEWQPIHKDVWNECVLLRGVFKANLKVRRAVSNSEIVSNWFDDAQRFICRIPENEAAAMLVMNEISITPCNVDSSTVFDALCNLWDYNSPADIQACSALLYEEQIDRAEQKAQEFIAWYSLCTGKNSLQKNTLRRAILILAYHRLAAHDLSYLVVSYLLS